jgi:hypothetical protein
MAAVPHPPFPTAGTPATCLSDSDSRWFVVNFICRVGAWRFQLGLGMLIHGLVSASWVVVVV